MPSEKVSRQPTASGKDWRGKADTWAGLATVVFGLYVLYVGADYGLGRAGRIGAGYVPVIIGTLLTGLGLLLLVRAGRSTDLVDTSIAWRQLSLVVGGIVTFALLLDRLGMVVAIAATVIVAAPAARGNTVLSVLISGVVLALFSWALFVHFLKIAIPVWWF
jgi:hypothetical protein